PRSSVVHYGTTSSRRQSFASSPHNITTGSSSASLGFAPARPSYNFGAPPRLSTSYNGGGGLTRTFSSEKLCSFDYDP
ncbi:unnamed protein product, partial [Amoebophrya sp. A120]